MNSVFTAMLRFAVKAHRNPRRDSATPMVDSPARTPASATATSSTSPKSSATTPYANRIDGLVARPSSTENWITAGLTPSRTAMRPVRRRQAHGDGPLSLRLRSVSSPVRRKSRRPASQQSVQPSRVQTSRAKVTDESRRPTIDGLPTCIYGGRSICGRSQAGWRWLDLRRDDALRLIGAESRRGLLKVRCWIESCTARRSLTGAETATAAPVIKTAMWRRCGTTNRLTESWWARFVASSEMRSPLAVAGRDRKPKVVTSQSDQSWCRIPRALMSPDAVFMASHIRSEEKGTDVNLDFAAPGSTC